MPPRSTSDPNTEHAPSWKSRSLRPPVLFVAAYSIVLTLHELAHALTAYILNVPSVLFHLYAQLDRTAGTPNEVAVIRAAGPLFCFGLGLVCLLAYRRARDTRAGLWLLYLGWFGVATLFGNLISTAFVGDFSGLAERLRLPMSIRYGLSITGALLLCGFAFFIGREFRRWAPAHVGRVKALFGVIVVPVIVGSALAFLIYLPIPFEFAVGRLAEMSFWIFAAVGAWFSRAQSTDVRDRGLSWADLAILLVAVVVVRLMVPGIAFVP